MTQPDKLESNSAPGINDRFADPSNLQSMVDHFRRPDRELYARRHDILNACPLSNEMTVVDFGAGTGELTFLLAEKVQHVWAVDLFDHFLMHIAAACHEQGLSNVSTHRCTKRSISLPAKSVDLLLMCNTYHHLEFPRSVMQSIYHALKADANFVLIDLHPANSGPAEHVRGTAESFGCEIEGCGFSQSFVDLDFFQSGYLQQFAKCNK